MPISAMQKYSNKSFDEIRYDNYKKNGKVAYIPADGKKKYLLLKLN